MVRGPDPGLIYHNLFGSGCCYHEPRARRGGRPMTTGIELGRPIEILLVEDNPGDVDLTREGLADGKIRNNLHVAGDGEEAMAFLRQGGEHADMPVPDLILLDLNLPRRDGREVLAAIKADERSKHIPVVILTSSQNDEDILRSYRLHANCYISKPVRRVRQGRPVHRGLLVHDRHPSHDPSEPRRRLSRARGIHRGGNLSMSPERDRRSTTESTEIHGKENPNQLPLSVYFCSTNGQNLRGVRRFPNALWTRKW